MADARLFDKIRIGIAGSSDILSWSHGEVKKPETINYRTFKPERDGLFCERIFGPVKDYECTCGRYKKIKYKGIICERCGVEVTRSKVRRERMGHIHLASPVCHIWYLKGVPSAISLLLDISPRQLEKVIYFASFIVIDIHKEEIESLIPAIQKAAEQEKKAIQQSIVDLEMDSLKELVSEMKNNPDEYSDEYYVRERMKANFDRIRAEYRDADDRIVDLDLAVEVLSRLEKNQLIEEDKWRAITRMLNHLGNRMNKDLSSLIRAGVGADAVRELLQKIDLDFLAKELRKEIVVSTSQKRARAIKRLELIESYLSSKSRPDAMILDAIPVISPELRPMVQLDGGRFATSDLNDLYRRIINRNNRLKKIIEIQAPESIINHEKRLLQESVDALIDNGRRDRPVVGSNSRPLKSLSDMLKGKEGRFRKNLLGKRVDYSGRSVIVVGPSLKLHQCGLPKEMALELFKPFVMKSLVEKKITQNIKTAKRMIDKMHPVVWDGLEEVIREHPVLLNRAPTLHRMGIQAFEPILVEGKAIQIHPLVCHAYNADFDGDQMAVHVPLSLQAQAEAKVLMYSAQNLFSPADGRPIITPKQDIVLGAYALTMIDPIAKDKLEKEISLHQENPEKNPMPRVYKSPDEVKYLLRNPGIDKIFGINDLIRVRISRPVFRSDDVVDFRDPETGQEYYYKNVYDEETETETKELVPYEQEMEYVIRSVTPGQLVLHDILPYPMRYSDEFLNTVLSGKVISTVILEANRVAGTERTVKLLDDLKTLGFKWATDFGISIALTDMDPPQRREEILQETEENSIKVDNQYRRGLLTFNEMQQNLVKLWTNAYNEIGKELVDKLSYYNPLNTITISGSRGSIKNLTQLSGMRGLMLNQFNEVIHELPVKNSFQRGLNMLEYFVTTYGARKGQADTALRTADAGYLTRRLVDVAQDVIIRKDDCETADGIVAHRILAENDVIEGIGNRLHGRVSLSTILDPKTEKPIISYDDLMTNEQAAAIEKLEEQYALEVEDAETEKERKEIADRYTKLGFIVNDHGLLCVKTRSPLTCELEQGICSKCYGIDLANGKLVDIGVAAGIISAQSIGEPGTQLTMNTFHSGGVAGSNSIARTNQYKTGKFIKQFMEDFGSATGTDFKDFDPTKLLESQESVIKDLIVNTDSEASIFKKASKATQKTLDKMDSDSKKLWDRSRKTFFYTWTGESSGIVRVEEIFEARRQPRGKAIICPVTGTVQRIDESVYGRWVVISAEVPITTGIRDAYVANEQDWAAQASAQIENKEKLIKESALNRLIGQKLSAQTLAILKKYQMDSVRILYPILVPPIGKLPVDVGSKVIKGDPLTEGPRDPHEVLDLAGANAVYDYFIENLQMVYKSQGVDINDKHIEVIIRQMLRKRQVVEPGDTNFLPGQIVDRFRYARECERVRDLMSKGKKIRYTDPVSGELIERDPREATVNWILLGITEASLATESFLSAASFQKTTKVLTDAAVRGKKDHLVGLKENVIIGRTVPAGTGMKRYSNINIEVDSNIDNWSKQSLAVLVDSDDLSISDENMRDLEFPTLSQLADEEKDILEKDRKE